MIKHRLVFTTALLSLFLFSGCTNNNLSQQRIEQSKKQGTYTPLNTGTITNGITTNAATGFSDVKSGQWFAANVQWAANLGLVSGYPDGTFQSDKAMTRAEVVTLLKSLADKGYLTVPSGSGATTPSTPTRSPAVATSEYTFEFSGVKDPADPRIIIEKMELAADNQGTYRASGNIKNLSPDLANSQVVCTIHFYDKNGKEISSGSGIAPSNLAAGSNTGFTTGRIYFPSSPPAVANAQLKVEQVIQR